MGYRSAFIHEAHACFRGRWFIVSLLATLGFAIAAGIECVARASYWHNLDSFYLSDYSAYAAWIVANCPIATLPTVFYYLLPLLVVIPFAWSFNSECISGYDAQMLARIKRSDRMLAKATIVFSSASLVTVLAHFINFIIVSLFLPLYTPVFEDVNILGIFTESLFSNLFYSHPLAYVMAYTALNGVLMGAWAVLVLGLSAVSRNRVGLMVFPYLCLLGWRYFNSWLSSVTLLYFPSFNVIDDMQGTYWSVRSEPLVIAAELGLMAMVALLMCRGLARADVI